MPVTQKELKGFLYPHIQSRYEDPGAAAQLSCALLAVYSHCAKKVIEYYVPLDALILSGHVELRNRRPYLTEMAKQHLGLARPKAEADSRVNEIIRIYRETCKEVCLFDPMELHDWGGIAKAAKRLLKEAAIHPKLKLRTPAEQAQGIERILRAMFYTEDPYDKRYFEGRSWHLWAFAHKFFGYISQMLEVKADQKKRQSRAQSGVDSPTATGREKL